MRFASGASPSRLHRHLPAVRLVSRHFPPLHVALCRFGSRAAPISRFVFAVRCALISRMRTAWLGVEYHSRRQSARLREPVRTPPNPNRSISCRASPCSVALFVVKFPICYCGASRALMPRFARRMCNGSLNDHNCANNWESARQGLNDKYCTQSVHALIDCADFSKNRNNY